MARYGNCDRNAQQQMLAADGTPSVADGATGTYIFAVPVKRARVEMLTTRAGRIHVVWNSQQSNPVIVAALNKWNCIVRPGDPRVSHEADIIRTVSCYVAGTGATLTYGTDFIVSGLPCSFAQSIQPGDGGTTATI